jgi:hypothetical protein
MNAMLVQGRSFPAAARKLSTTWPTAWAISIAINQLMLYLFRGNLSWHPGGDWLHGQCWISAWLSINECYDCSGRSFPGSAMRLSTTASVGYQHSYQSRNAILVQGRSFLGPARKLSTTWPAWAISIAINQWMLWLFRGDLSQDLQWDYQLHGQHGLSASLSINECYTCLRGDLSWHPGGDFWLHGQCWISAWLSINECYDCSGEIFPRTCNEIINYG